jgi:hypothetical protein
MSQDPSKNEPGMLPSAHSKQVELHSTKQTNQKLFLIPHFELESSHFELE